MITKDQINRIEELKARGYSQSKIAEKLKMSRSTVQRHWRGKKLKLEDLFQIGRCHSCRAPIPKPKFLHSWTCPACKKPLKWEDSQFFDQYWEPPIR